MILYTLAGRVLRGGVCVSVCVCVQRGVGGSWVVNKDYRQSKTATLLLIYFLNPL